jgi:hypothetical protein
MTNERLPIVETEREPTAYEVVERDARFISNDGEKGPLIVLKEIGTYAERNGAPVFGGAVHEALTEINRKSARIARLTTELKSLLFALGARPLFGGPHLDLETAIARAIETLDGAKA